MSVFNIKFYLGLIFFVVLNTSIGVAQTPPARPAACTTLAGYTAGGSISFNPQEVCIPQNATLGPLILINKRDPNPAINYTLDDAKFYIDIDNTFNINTAVPVIPVSNTNATVNLTKGYHWIMLTGTKGTQKHFYCQVIEVYSTAEPVAEVNSCGSLKVDITIPINPSNFHERYKIDWKDGSPIEIINISTTTPLPITKSHTYVGVVKDPAIQGVTVRSNTEVCSPQWFVKKADNTSKPLIHTLSGENGGAEANLIFTNFTGGKVYEVESKKDDGVTTNWTKIGDAQNGTFSATGLDLSSNYCFRLKTKNSCNVDVYSMNTICSINLKSKLNSTTEVELKWNKPTDPAGVPTRLELLKDKVGCGTCANSIPLASNVVTSYTDKSIICGDKYTFRVSSRYPSITVGTTAWPIKVLSQQITVDPKSNAVSIKPNNIVQVGYDNINDKTVRITIAIPAGSNIDQYKFYRAENQSTNFIEIGKSNNSSFEDVSVNGGATSYCYKYKILDACGIETEFSDPFCTISLTSKTSGILDWTPYLIPPDIYTSATKVQYRVRFFDEFIGAWNTLAPTSNLYQDIQDMMAKSKEPEIKFRIEGMQNIDVPGFPPGQFINSNSNTYVVSIPPGIYIPSAFSPDGNGPIDSETLKVNTKFVASGNIRIYDRWGAIMYSSDSLGEAWDGSEINKIKPAPPGNYAYTIDAISATGQKFKINGSVVLLR